jgi:hypothetical protein
MIDAMKRRTSRLLTVVTLVLWVVSGPIGMAFNGCAMMGSMCEAPCGIASYISGPAASGAGALQPAAYFDADPTQQPATLVAAPPSPPPKLALLSA